MPGFQLVAQQMATGMCEYGWLMASFKGTEYGKSVARKLAEKVGPSPETVPADASEEARIAGAEAAARTA
jgi:hypothetical protein